MYQQPAPDRLPTGSRPALEALGAGPGGGERLGKPLDEDDVAVTLRTGKCACWFALPKPARGPARAGELGDGVTGDGGALEELEVLMTAALEEAERARGQGEVPIGAVVALDGRIVGRGCNQPISAGDPTAHAEIVAIRAAAREVGNYRLSGATVCVTIEPCLMCVGALVHARIGRLVYGAAEPRTGAIVSTVTGGELPGLNHRFEVVAGVQEDRCRELVQAFFRGRR